MGQPVNPSYTGRIVTFDPFLFDGLAQPDPFFDGPHRPGQNGPG